MAVTSSVIQLQFQGFVNYCIQVTFLATSESSGNSSLSHSTVHRSRSPRESWAVFCHIYPCGESQHTCKDDVRIHEVLHGFCEHVCQGMLILKWHLLYHSTALRFMQREECLGRGKAREINECLREIFIFKKMYIL